jgi:hypothetical protein
MNGAWHFPAEDQCLTMAGSTLRQNHSQVLHRQLMFRPGSLEVVTGFWRRGVVRELQGGRTNCPAAGRGVSRIQYPADRKTSRPSVDVEAYSEFLVPGPLNKAGTEQRSMLGTVAAGNEPSRRFNRSEPPASLEESMRPQRQGPRQRRSAGRSPGNRRRPAERRLGS